MLEDPRDTISVGTQVSGRIQTIVADYNDHVHQGQVLARLDPTQFQAALNQSRSNLSQAQAQWQAALANAQGAKSGAVAAFANADAVAMNMRITQEAMTSADANVAKARADLRLAGITLSRDRELLRAGYISRSQYNVDDANQVAADSALRSAVVTASQARMQLSAAQAQVEQAMIDLNHTVITSPVDGTVIARTVSMGQTVAASFQTPTLYTIAKDLAKMEVDFAVGEPDIGSVRAGQRVNFTVLAYPDYTFHQTVAQVRENPTIIQNVVTYDTVVYENNADGRLRPGMTASAHIEVARATDAFVVPLAALSFRAPVRRPHVSTSAAPRAARAATSWGNTGGSENATVTAGSMAKITLVDRGSLRMIPADAF